MKTFAEKTEKHIKADLGAIKMPSCCDVCPVRHLNWDRNWFCGITGNYIKNAGRDFDKKRADDCPLEEVMVMNYELEKREETKE